MKKFPPTIVEELTRVFEAVPIVVYRNPNRPGVTLPERPLLEAITSERARDRECVEVVLKYKSGRRIVVVMSSSDFDGRRRIPGGGNLSQIAYWISILALEQIFSMNEEDLPDKLFLKP